MARDNVDLIEAAWASFAKGDLQAAAAIIAPEGEVHAPDSLPWGGTYIGPEGLQAMLATLRSGFSQFKATPLKVLGADDDHVVVLAETRGRTRDGTALEARSVWLYKFREGRVESVEAYIDTAGMLEQLGGSR